MLDAARGSLETGDVEQATELLVSIAERQRDAIRSLRDLSFALEPIILRDQGFAPAVEALAEQLGVANKIRIDLDLADADDLAERAKVVLYQIIRDSLHQALRRGPLTRVSVTIKALDDGGVETVITDDGADERRRRVWEAIEERARALQGIVSVTGGEAGGTTLQIVLPAYTAR